MKLRKIVVLIAAAGLVLPASVGRAAQHDTGAMMAPHGDKSAPAAMPALDSVEDLRAEIARLRERVAVLEALKATMSNIMPNFAERFHVMHGAADAEDWALAAHELAEIERLVGVSPLIDPKAGALMQAFLSGHLRTLQEAIEHGNKRGFDRAVDATIESCNGCHAATGSKITVSLDVDEGLSIRHPHALKKSKVPKGHTH